MNEQKMREIVDEAIKQAIDEHVEANEKLGIAFLLVFLASQVAIWVALFFTK